MERRRTSSVLSSDGIFGDKVKPYFTRGRIRFMSPGRVIGTPLRGQAFIYIGNDVKAFLNVFNQYGWGARL